MDNDIDATLKDLQLKVNQLVSTNTQTKQEVTNTSLMSKYNIKNVNIYYVAVPLAIMIQLYLFKPSFVMLEVTNEDGTTTKKVSIKKMFMSVLVISSIIFVTYGIYTYKKKTDKI
jgi:hypothetical protein